MEINLNSSYINFTLCIVVCQGNVTRQTYFSQLLINNCLINLAVPAVGSNF